MAADIKAAQLRALAAEEKSRKLASAATPTPKPGAPVNGNGKLPLVPRLDGAKPPGQRISIADMREEKRILPGIQLKKVVDYLKKVRRDVGIEEIKRETGAEVDDQLKYSLEGNPKVAITPDGRYRFKPKYDIRNKEELLDAVSQSDDGLPMEDLMDCYDSIKEDAQNLQEQKKIILLTNSDTKQDVLYPNDPQFRMDVSTDFREMWAKLTSDLPPELYMEEEMRKIGLKPAKQAKQQKIERSSEDQPKAKVIRKNMKIHNVHIAGYADEAKKFDPRLAQPANKKNNT